MLPLALGLVAAIAFADYLTGYEVRLAILYLVPVAITTWTCGRIWGLAIAALASLAWVVSFARSHHYTSDVFFYWEYTLMAVTFVLFVELLARLHAALLRSDERFVRVLEGLYAAVYVTDDANRVLFANRRLARLLDSGSDAPSVRDLTARFSFDDSDAAAEPQATPDSAFVATEARDKVDGRWYLVQAGSIPWVDRRPARLHVMTDITDQKLAQSLQREQEAALHHTARLMNLAEAGATLAHELNQPLLAIVGYNAACLRLLDLDNFARAELQEAMERLRAQAVRAGEIVNRLHELTQRRAPRLAQCDVNAMIRQALRWAEPDLERANVAADVALAEALSPVSADRILVEQVLLNLIQNAVDAVRDGEDGHRNVRLASSQDRDGSIVVTVSDRGPGIAPAVAERLYTPFFTTKEHGLGLGLAICRSVIELHGGRLWHSANRDGGTAFHFTLPVGKA